MKYVFRREQTIAYLQKTNQHICTNNIATGKHSGGGVMNGPLAVNKSTMNKTKCVVVSKQDHDATRQ